MSKSKENKTVVEPTVESMPEIAPVEEKVAVYIGKIRDCDKLNVREEPNLEAKVLCRLDKNSEVEIDKTNSTKDFYKICTSSGISGYCMKKHLSIKKREA